MCAAVEQAFRGSPALFFGCQRIELERRVFCDSPVLHCFQQPTVPAGKFRIVVVGMAEKSNAPSSTLNQVPTGELAGGDVIRPDRDAARVARNRTPAREMRALSDELLHSFAVFGVIAIAQQDQPVGTVAVLVLDVPVILHALERYQQV